MHAPITSQLYAYGLQVICSVSRGGVGLHRGGLDLFQTPLTTAGDKIKLLYNTPLHPTTAGIIKLLNCRHIWSCVGRSGQKEVESFHTHTHTNTLGRIPTLLPKTGHVRLIRNVF